MAGRTREEKRIAKMQERKWKYKKEKANTGKNTYMQGRKSRYKKKRNENT